MTHKQVSPKDFTPTIGAYSHGTSFIVGSAKFLFTTGQIAMDKNGAVISDDIEEQTVFVFQNLEKILHTEGMNFNDVVKVQIFVTDMNDFQKISPIRNKFLGESKPVSTLVEVSKLVKEGCKIEIEATAVKSMSHKTMPSKTMNISEIDNR